MLTEHRISFITAAIFSILIAVGFYYFPLISDDLKSIIFCKETFLYDSTLDFDAFWENIIFIFKTNHFRLPNVLMPLIILLPKWIPAFLSGASLFYIYIAGAKLGSFAGSLNSMILYIFGIVFIFPWIDQLYLISFQAPYLWGAAFSILLLKWIFDKDRPSNILLFLFCVFLGTWQEAYAGTIVAACICLMIFYRTYRTMPITIIIIGLCCGMAINSLPLILFNKWTRWTFLEDRMIMIYPYVFITLVFVPVFLIVYKKNKSVLNPFILTLLEISIASSIMAIYFKTGARVAGLGIICSIIGIISLLKARIAACGGLFSKALFGAIGLITLVHIIVVDIECYKLGNETDYVVNRYRSHNESPVFATMTFRENAPWIALQKPYYDWFAHSRTLELFNCIYGNDSVMLEVAPAELRQFDIEKSELIPGTAHIYWYKGNMVGVNLDTNYFNVDFGRGKVERRFHTVAFSQQGKRTYFWMHPDNTIIDFLLHPKPLSIDISTH